MGGHVALMPLAPSTDTDLLNSNILTSFSFTSLCWLDFCLQIHLVCGGAADDFHRGTLRVEDYICSAVMDGGPLLGLRMPTVSPLQAYHHQRSCTPLDCQSSASFCQTNTHAAERGVHNFGSVSLVNKWVCSFSFAMAKRTYGQHGLSCIDLHVVT